MANNRNNKQCSTKQRIQNKTMKRLFALCLILGSCTTEKIDFEPNKQVNYYRIETVNLGGTIEYSQIISKK